MKRLTAVLTAMLLPAALCFAGCTDTGNTANESGASAAVQVQEPAAAQEATPMTASDQGLPADTQVIGKTIVCEGLEKTVRLAFISDLHLIAKEDVSEGDASEGPFAIDPASRETIARRDQFFARGGMTAEEYWAQLAPQLDTLEADAVLLGGDMMDFITPAAAASLQEGLEKIRTPMLYVRADHDTGLWYCGGAASEEDAAALQDTLADNRDIMVL